MSILVVVANGYVGVPVVTPTYGLSMSLAMHISYGEY
jgi:hypothetical protein